MSKVSKEGFFFIHSSVFDTEQIEQTIKFCIRKLGRDPEKCSIYVNVVENKDGQKFGHTYAWISDREVFNALIGKNFDGTLREEEVEDDEWEEPSLPLEEALLEANGDWGLEAEIEDRYEVSTKLIKLPPIIVPPGIKYKPEQKKLLNVTEDFGFIELFPARITIRSEETKSNSLYSSCLPGWVSEEMLFKFFKRFSSDTIAHRGKTNKTFYYPIITITKNTTQNKWSSRGTSFKAHINFSPLDKYIAYFISNLARKIKLKNPNTGKYEMLFFSQSRTRT